MIVQCKGIPTDADLITRHRKTYLAINTSFGIPLIRGAGLENAFLPRPFHSVLNFKYRAIFEYI